MTMKVAFASCSSARSHSLALVQSAFGRIRLAGVVALAVIGTLIVPAAHAQQQAPTQATPQAAPAAAATPLPLSLSQAVATAIKLSPQVQVAILNTALSVYNKNIARSALLPQVIGEVSERRFRANLETLLGQKIPNFPQHVGPIDVFSGGPNFSATIFDLSLWRRFQATREGITASRADEQTTREQMTLAVVSQYLAALRAAADEQAARARLTLAEALYRQAVDLQNQGVGTGIDTLRANVEMQNERQRLIQAGVQFRTALFGLVRLLNLDPSQDIVLTDRMSFFQLPSLDIPAELAAARTNRPELRSLAAQERLLRFQQQAASASRFPTLRLVGNWSEQGLTPAKSIPVYTYQLNLDFPLFTGGRITAERAGAETQIRRLAQQRQDVLNQISLEVKTAAAELEAARGEVDVANLAVKLAEEEVGQARDRFNAGVATNIEVITAQDALARANDNQIAALFRYNQARANLAHATGQIEKLYVK